MAGVTVRWGLPAPLGIEGCAAGEAGTVGACWPVARRNARRSGPCSTPPAPRGVGRWWSAAWPDPASPRCWPTPPDRRRAWQCCARRASSPSRRWPSRPSSGCSGLCALACRHCRRRSGPPCRPRSARPRATATGSWPTSARW